MEGPRARLVADLVEQVSGPVANSLAQFEDAAREAGFDLEFVFVEFEMLRAKLQVWLESKEDEYLPEFGHRFRLSVAMRIQRLGDQLAVLKPSWRLERLEADHAEALGLKSRFDGEFGPERLPRDGFGMPARAPAGFSLFQRIDPVLGVRYRLERDAPLAR